MKNLKKMIIPILTVLFFSCGKFDPSAEEKSANYDKKEALTDSVASYSETVSSSAARANKDSSRKFIRTANLKFRVENVRTTTFKIEDVVTQFNGFVTSTNLYSNVDRKTLVPVSNDSSLESTFFTVQNNMVIRIPNENLDTTLKSLAKWIDYLDYRTITANDVTLSLLENKLTQKRIKLHENRLVNAIDARGKKLNETVNAEQNLLDKQIQKDEAVINNLRMQDNIEYSTIVINMYQRMTVDRELIKNEKNMEAYKPGFLQQSKEALVTGWNVLEFIIILFLRIWPLLLIGVIVYFIIKRLFNKK